MGYKLELRTTDDKKRFTNDLRLRIIVIIIIIIRNNSNNDDKK